MKGRLTCLLQENSTDGTPALAGTRSQATLPQRGPQQQAMQFSSAQEMQRFMLVILTCSSRQKHGRCSSLQTTSSHAVTRIKSGNFP